MKKSKLLIFTFGLCIIALLTACSSSEEVALSSHAEHDTACPKCHMKVKASDTYTATISKNNKVSYFDDIGCMVLWAKENSIDLQSDIKVFTSDTKKYIPAHKAKYKINATTPMMYGFCAYESEDKDYIDFNEVVIKMLRGEHMGNPKIRKQLLKL
ncbi:hypothetical protein KJ877_06730 [bacterium]|nr:hypothetical protein [bacterium]MBU1991337.1 hypothetical protein [bacterium]